MSFQGESGRSDADRTGLCSVAPSRHIDALLRALETTDRSLTPITSRGMDGRTASILREIETSGAISVRANGDALRIDVNDRRKVRAILNHLTEMLRHRRRISKLP